MRELNQGSSSKGIKARELKQECSSKSASKRQASTRKALSRSHAQEGLVIIAKFFQIQLSSFDLGILM